MARLLTVFFAMLFLVGCTTSTGAKIDPSVLQSFKPGVTTKDEVVAKLGDPTVQTMDARGYTDLKYAYTQTDIGAKAFIPFANLTPGATKSSMQVVELVFDSRGVLTNDSPSNTSPGFH
jgi:outer membrane protein assembly factor BamE (lipoprotein component of BamABCDE complex)